MVDNANPRSRANWLALADREREIMSEIVDREARRFHANMIDRYEYLASLQSGSERRA